jgi:hypothetical protein
MKMDDIWGLLFYIAIIVLGGLASAYRNKQKRKMVVPSRPKPQEEPTIDEIPVPDFNPFEPLTKTYEFNVEEPVVKTEVKPEITFQSDVVSLETIARTPEEEGVATLEETREAIEYDLLQSDDTIASSQITDIEIKDEIQQKIDLNLAANIKQGIIYSEILKRKHF